MKPHGPYLPEMNLLDLNGRTSWKLNILSFRLSMGTLSFHLQEYAIFSSENNVLLFNNNPKINACGVNIILEEINIHYPLLCLLSFYIKHIDLCSNMSYILYISYVYFACLPVYLLYPINTLKTDKPIGTEFCKGPHMTP